MNGIVEHERDVQGYRTYYQTAGAGRPLLLIHGVGGSSVTFRHNMEELASRYRVYALDLPGHGRSEIPTLEYQAEDAVPFLAQFIREVIGEPVALVGVSAGGLMCALTAAQHPDLVTHLVMVASAGLGRDVDWGLRLLSLPVARIWMEYTREHPKAVRMSLKKVLHNADLITDDLVNVICKERAQPGSGKAMHRAIQSNIGLLGLRRWRRHRSAIRTVAAPVMIIWGAQDKFIPVRHAYRAMRHLADVPVHILDHCGHWPPFEHPREFNRLVTEFLG